MKKRIEYDAPATSRTPRAWVIGTADTNRSEGWLDLDVRVILQMGEYEAQKKWLDSILTAFEVNPSAPIKMPRGFVERAYKNVKAAEKKLLAVPLKEGQKQVWPAWCDKFTSMSLDEFQAYCDEWINSQIRGWYDTQMLEAVFLRNPNPTYGDFGPYEIHPNAVAVPNTLKIQDVRMSGHPWGRGKASQW